MKLKTRAEFARICGVTSAAITWACRTKLAPACHGDRIDIEHPTAVEYRKRQRAKKPTRRPSKARGKSKLAKSPPKSRAATPPKPNPKGAGRKRRSSSTAEPPPDVAAPPLDENGFCPEIEDLRAKEISERYGTSRAYVDWLDAYQKQQRGRELYLKNEQTEGSLISRELVRAHVFGMIDALFRRLVTDVPKATAAELFVLAKSGSSLEHGKRKAKELIEKQLKPAKARIVRVLKKRSAGA